MITICATCGPGLTDALSQALPNHSIRKTACMSGCTRPATVAFRAPGKTAYLFGDLTATDVPDLTRFAQLYDASPDGNFPDARILGDLRLKAIARIPG